MDDDGALSRAQGCLLGQFAGDALGGLVEFKSPEFIAAKYPYGVRVLADGGTWNTIAGQPTDDSEMALMLARYLASPKGKRGYNASAVRERYLYWLDSEPFDSGLTVQRGLAGDPNPKSQANGALMRVSPLGVFGARFPLAQVARWAMEDAALTHPHPVCLQVNALFAMAVATAVREETSPQRLVDLLFDWTRTIIPNTLPDVFAAMTDALKEPPECYGEYAGWVLKTFGSAIYELAHTSSLEEAVVNTIGRGGDTDTNAAVCGALFGAVYGLTAVPPQWRDSVLHCRPREGDPRVRHPRPECFWPVDALELAAELIAPRTDGSLRWIRDRVKGLFDRGGEGEQPETAAPPPADADIHDMILRARELLREMWEIMSRNGESNWIATIGHCLACIGEDADSPDFRAKEEFPGVEEAWRTYHGIHGGMGSFNDFYIHDRTGKVLPEDGAFFRARDALYPLLSEINEVILRRRRERDPEAGAR